MTIDILVNGAGGKMGKAILARVSFFKEIAGVLPVDMRNKNEGPSLVKKAAVIIDFTNPAAALEMAGYAFRNGKPFVTGTTGFSPAQLGKLSSFSKKIPVFVSPNMSPAVNLTFALSRILAQKLDFDIHIHETHHKAKKDAPSGTALRYLKFIEAAGKKASVTSARIGDVTGEHVLTFAGRGEKVVLSHTATSREIFADGAIRAALWLAKKRPGLYDFFDLLGIKTVKRDWRGKR